MRKESSVPCDLVAVDKLPKEYCEENFYGHVNSGCKDGDELYHFAKYGIAEALIKGYDEHNRAAGARVKSKTIYYLKNFTFEHKVIDKVTYTPCFTVNYHNIHMNGPCAFENLITDEFAGRLNSLGFRVKADVGMTYVQKDWIHIEGLESFNKFMSENKDIMNFFRVKMTS